MSEVIRELNWDERARYGECPVCHAKHGESCDGMVGIPLGRRVSGTEFEPIEGAHLGRLQRAPFKVREIPVE